MPNPATPQPREPVQTEAQTETQSQPCWLLSRSIEISSGCKPAERTYWLPTLDRELKDCHVCAPWSRPHCSASGSSARLRSLQDGSGRAQPPPLRVARSI